MAEFNLRINELNIVKDKYDDYQPIGSVISGFSDRIIRRKWIEIVCDLWRPSLIYKGKRLASKREQTTANFIANCGWTQERCDAIGELWSESLWLKWMQTETDGPDVDVMKDQIWTEDIIKASGWVDAIGKEPNGVENVVNCAIWSLDNLKNFYMVAADGLTNTEAEQVGGKKVDVYDFREVVMPRHVIKWDTSLALTTVEIADIFDTSKVVFPRYDRKITKVDIKRAKPEDFVKAESVK